MTTLPHDLPGLLELFERRAGHPLFIDAQGDGETVTYGEALERAHTVAAGLTAAGAGPGDVVAVAMPNGVALATLYLGALAGGQVVMPLNPGLGRRELRWALDHAQPALLVGDEPGAAIEQVAGDTGTRIAGSDDLTGTGTDAARPPGPRPAGDIVAIHLTSGSTGRPRGVAHRIEDFLANAGRVAEAAAMDPELRFHHVLPMTYVAGYYNLLVLPLALGATIVVDRAFDALSARGYWKTVEKHEIDALWLAPTMLAMLLESDRRERGWDGGDRVRVAMSGTAPLSNELRDRFAARFGVRFRDSYGLSETLLVTVSGEETGGHGPAAVGRVLDGIELSSRDVPGIGDRELLVRAGETSPGYLTGRAGRQLALEDVTEDGWFPTGDLGHVDDDGILHITGRRKEIVIRGGANISPAAVEQSLEQDCPVSDLAIVGLPDPLLGEELVAVVAPAAGEDFDELEAALRVHAGERLPQSQRPGSFMQIDVIPRTPTGKVRRAHLRALLVEQLGLDDGPAETAGAGSTAGGPRIVDLSHPLREGMLTFPGLNHPRIEITQLARHRVEGRATRRLVLGSHSGTHLDAPLHFIEGGATVDQLALTDLVGPAQLADLTPAGDLEEIGLERLRDALGGSPRQPRLLLRFDWSRHFGSIGYYHRSPYLTEECCRWLVAEGVRVLGMDTASPDDPRNDAASGNDSPNHRILLGAGVILLEYLTGLDALRCDEPYLVALPLPVEGSDGAPARIVAIDGPGPR